MPIPEFLLAGRPLGAESGHEAGQKLLAALYRAHTGQSPPPVLRTPRGKPYFADGKLHFSISHTRHHVFCALSSENIGIDAEELERNVNLRLAEKILSPMEYAQFEMAADKRLALLTFWVLKEAYGKFTGGGLNGYPNHTRFYLDDPRVTVQDNCLLAVIKEEDYAL